MKKLVKTIAGLAGVWAGGSYAAVQLAYKHMFGRSSLLKYSLERKFADFDEKYPGRYVRRSVKIPEKDYQLQGYVYDLAERRRTKGLVIFSHGIFAGHQSYTTTLLDLVDRGYVVLGYDNTGCCESPGDGVNGLPQGPLDLECVLKYVDTDPELKDMPRFLFGHSWGGYSVCAVLQFYSKVKGVVSISGFDTPLEVTSEMGVSMLGKAVKVTRPMIALENRRRFGSNANLSAIEGINSCTVPVLVMHGTGDDYVNYNGAGILHHRDEVTNPNASFIPLDYPNRNGHNDFFLSASAKEYTDQIEEWFKPLKKKYKVKNRWDLPEEEQAMVFRDVDMDRCTEINRDLMEKIDGFFMSCQG